PVVISDREWYVSAHAREPGEKRGAGGVGERPLPALPVPDGGPVAGRHRDPERDPPRRSRGSSRREVRALQDVGGGAPALRRMTRCPGQHPAAGGVRPIPQTSKAQVSSEDKAEGTARRGHPRLFCFAEAESMTAVKETKAQRVERLKRDLNPWTAFAEI